MFIWTVGDVVAIIAVLVIVLGPILLSVGNLIYLKIGALKQRNIKKVTNTTAKTTGGK